MGYSPQSCKESDTTEWLSTHSQLINNAVMVSGEQQRDSATQICVSILPKTPLLSRVPPIQGAKIYNLDFVPIWSGLFP